MTQKSLALLSLLIGVTFSSAAEFDPVDLSSVLQKRLSTYKPNESWAAPPRGRQVLAGVPFQIEGKIEVTGLGAARDDKFFPTRVSGIKIGRKCERLHILNGTGYNDAEGTPIARLTLHYANGRSHALPLIYGVHTRNWYVESGERTGKPSDTNSVIAWTGSPQGSGLKLRLFKTAFENPYPDQEISTIDFVSLFSRATPVIVAMTLENTGKRAAAGMPAKPFDDTPYRGEMAVKFVDSGGAKLSPSIILSVTATEAGKTYKFGEYTNTSSEPLRLDYSPQMTALELNVRSLEFMPFRTNLAKGAGERFPQEAVLTVSRGARIGGLVRDPGGRPITNAEVTIFGVLRDDAGQVLESELGMTKSDAAGNWSAACVPKDFEGLSFKVTHPRFMSGDFAQSDITDAAVRREALLGSKAIFQLEPGITVEGYVTDSEGEPINGATVLLSRPTSPLTNEVVKTDRRGKFSFFTLERGDVQLLARASGYAPRLLLIETEPRMPAREIHLTNSRPLRMRVIADDDKPVEGAAIRLDSWRGAKLLEWSTNTDVAGRVEWTEAPEDVAKFNITKPGFRPLNDVALEPGTNATLKIYRVPMISGTVVDADTKQPIPQFKFFTGTAHVPDEAVHWERYNAMTGRDGKFSYEVRNTANGFALAVEAPGYWPARTPRYTNSGPFTYHFALKKGEGFRGVLQHPNGEPVAGALIVMADASDHAYMDREGEFRADAMRNTATAVSDKDGKFLLPPRLDPHTIFAADGTGYAEVPASEVIETGKLVLKPWGRVEGKLQVGGKPETNQSVAIHNMGYRYGDGTRSSPPLSLWLNKRPDADGNFVFEKVPPGTRRIYLQYKFSDRPGTIPVSHGFAIEVKPGETTKVTLGGSGRRIVGKIVPKGSGADRIDWVRDVHWLTLKVPDDPENHSPAKKEFASQGERAKAYTEYGARHRAFWRSERGHQYERQPYRYCVVFKPDGSFYIPDIPPGEYTLAITPMEPTGENWWQQRQLGVLIREIVVPEGSREEPVDLGTLELQLKDDLRNS
jgi:carboxypeptidase family protein